MPLSMRDAFPFIFDEERSAQPSTCCFHRPGSVYSDAFGNNAEHGAAVQFKNSRIEWYIIS